MLGVQIGVSLPDGDPDGILDKVEAAVRLIHEFSPRQFARLSQHARILVFGMVGPLGEWYQDARVIKLKEAWVTRPNTHLVHVATTIIHETSHAWLDDRGIQYLQGRRRRIEAMCYRAEARFAARLPGCEKLEQYYRDRARDVLSQTDQEWSDDAFYERDIKHLSQLGTPPWLLRILDRRGTTGSAV